MTSRSAAVVGVGGSDESKRALDWAADEATQRQRPLRIVHAVDHPRFELDDFPSAYDVFADAAGNDAVKVALHREQPRR